MSVVIQVTLVIFMFYECRISSNGWHWTLPPFLISSRATKWVWRKKSPVPSFSYTERKIIRFLLGQDILAFCLDLWTPCVWLDFQVGQAREFCLGIPAPGSGLASLAGSVCRGSGAIPEECHLHQGLSFWKGGNQNGNWCKCKCSSWVPLSAL